MKALVLGASGRIGKALFSQLSQGGSLVVGTYFSNPFPKGVYLDLRDYEQVKDIFCSEEFDVVFVPAAETNVDRCEEGALVNTIGIETITFVLANYSPTTRIVFFSTDFVFPGEGTFSTLDLVHPINQYGREKVYAEHHVLSTPGDHIIVRTSWVFDEGHNFITWVAKELNNHKTLTLSENQTGNPSFAPDVAKAAISLAKDKYSQGIYHVCGKHNMSRFEVGSIIQSHLEKGEVIPGEPEPQLAHRPENLGLSTHAPYALSSLDKIIRIVEHIKSRS